MRRRYRTLYERLVANSEPADPDNPQSCWLWAGGTKDGRYPAIAVRVPGKATPAKLRAHRVMLQELHGVRFPFDDAGHLCYTTMCIHPDHLEVQPPGINQLERRGGWGGTKDDRCIPILFPVIDKLQAAADAAFDGIGATRGGCCPF